MLLLVLQTTSGFNRQLDRGFAAVANLFFPVVDTISGYLLTSPIVSPDSEVLMIASKSVKKGAPKKAAVRKTASQKATGGKQKTAVRKTATGKQAVKKAVTKKKAPGQKKTAGGEAAGKKVAPRKSATKTGGKASRISRRAASGKTPPAPKELTGRQQERFRRALLDLRDRLTGQITSLKNGSLTRQDSTNLQEDGTDAFDREVALKLVTSEHEAVFQIDEALRRLAEGQYGVCESCGCLVDIPRLEALPFVRMCVQCQAEQERGGAGVRPFGARRRRPAV